MICNTVLSYVQKPSDIEKIENYDKAIADKNHTWHCHHRLEIMPYSKNTASATYLKEQNMYYNQSSDALIFLTASEHHKLHRNEISYESKRKISDSMKGHICSDETKKKDF